VHRQQLHGKSCGLASALSEASFPGKLENIFGNSFSCTVDIVANEQQRRDIVCGSETPANNVTPCIASCHAINLRPSHAVAYDTFLAVEIA